MVRNPEAKPLHNQLYLAEKELRWLEGRAEVAHAALSHHFGDSRLAPVHTMRTREYLINNATWNQFGFIAASEVAQNAWWQPVLAWLADHPYALLVGDADTAKMGGKRDKVDIDYALHNEAPKEWIGPQRYSSEVSLFVQKPRAE
ncbi:MAG: hypothetical protein QG639_794, partial [Patescibacteria group bacterium]|nr:hypothetical protein [Patescibacteria group bacterium]